MVHRLIIALVHTVANTFFRRIDVVGFENVPRKGPVIFAGNHPNALMDGFLLVAKCGRWPLHFMANSKLWKFRILSKFLDAMGAVPVYRREEHDGDVDNERAFARLYEVMESGDCIGIFPEGISHVESQLARLKTGTARIALAVSAREKVRVRIVPCGLSYMHRHRFRSQVLIDFGEPIEITDEWLRAYREDEQATVRRLTDHLAESMSAVTLNAPDWNTLRVVQTARRLYKPASRMLSPSEYIELNRRFVAHYVHAIKEPPMQRLRDELEDYQARLDLLGIKDYQLRQQITPAQAFRKLTLRSMTLLTLLPLAIPGAMLHLPVGWIAATVGDRFSYEQDDIATLKVFATILLLPLLYVALAIVIGVQFGFWWAIFAVLVLPLSFFASVRLLEAEASLLLSMLSILKLTRLNNEIEDLRVRRVGLVRQVREMVDRHVDQDLQRIISESDFADAHRQENTAGDTGKYRKR